MSQRRVSEITFNFDSLTDLVTNLAGALIMIVLLFFCLSSERVKKAATAAVMGTTQPEGSTSRPSSTVPSLRASTAEYEAKLKEQEDAIRKLRAQIAEIDRKAAQEQPKEFADPGGDPGKPAVVDLRPPMLKATEKKVAVTFVMLHNRVYFYKDAELNKSASEVLSDLRDAVIANKDTSSFESGIVKRLQTGDFDVTFRVLGLKNGPTPTYKRFQGTLKLKSDARGESEAEAGAPGSNYNLLIQDLDPDASLIDNCVYPDSFELFRKLRDAALGRRLDYTWDPIDAGQDKTYPFGIGQGFTIAQ